MADKSRMPVDMMLEAMKVVYTKSVSGHSRSSMFSRSSSLPRGSQYGFFGSPSSSTNSTGTPSLHQGRNYHEASEAVASSLKSRSSVLTTHLLFHTTAVLPNFGCCMLES